MSEQELTHLLLYRYVADMLEHRGPHRAAHLRRIEELRAAGALIVAGAYGDPPHGAAIGVRGLRRDEVLAWSDGDPYMSAGLVLERSVEPWKLV